MGSKVSDPEDVSNATPLKVSNAAILPPNPHVCLGPPHLHDYFSTQVS